MQWKQFSSQPTINIIKNKTIIQLHKIQGSHGLKMVTEILICVAINNIRNNLALKITRQIK